MVVASERASSRSDEPAARSDGTGAAGRRVDGERYEALMFGWAGTAVPDRRSDASVVRSRVEQLSAAGVHLVVVDDADAGTIDRQLQARPPGPGRLLLCANRGTEVFEVSATGVELVWRHTASAVDDTQVHLAGAEAEWARWAAAWLDDRGITGRLVLVVVDELGALGGVRVRDRLAPVPALGRAVVVSVGTEVPGASDGVVHLGGGPDRLGGLMEEQLSLRRDRRVPWVDEDPAWVVALPGGPGVERLAESIGALSNGWASIRASREEGGPEAAPLFAVNGVYTDDAVPQLLSGPPWTGLDAQVEHGERLLDLRTGVLVRRDPSAAVRTLRFVSAARREVLALRAEGPPSQLDAGDPFVGASPGTTTTTMRGDIRVARTVAGPRGIAVAAGDWTRTAMLRTVERIAAWTGGPATAPDADDAVRLQAEAQRQGFDHLLAEHREAWAGRWADASVAIEGDADDQLAARFATFHLLSAAPDGPEAAVGARGLSGPAYGGHVFWDADVCVLPVLAAIRPRAARAMLEYRLRRLGAARAIAAAAGRRGARFPWESATDGFDVTPRSVVGPGGKSMQVHTGQREEHIVSDVAWAACEYASWTGDTAFLANAGGDLVIEAARYWASRVRLDTDGRAHLDGVMGPDEYHDAVDDNAYTNVTARWSLRRAAELAVGRGVGADEAGAWRRLAACVVDGWDPERGLYEQFAGYWDLEPLLVAHVATPPVAADLLLGAERVSGSQLIKQPDVLMLHHLVPDEVRPGSLIPALRFYEPRTAHGSSLSPAVHAALFARAGQPQRALELFRLAARLDLDDLTGTTAGGLHLGAMGGVWQALAYGFLGLRPRPDVLDVDPCLPAEWDAVELSLRFGGQRIAVRGMHDQVEMRCSRTFGVRVAGGPTQPCEAPGQRFTLNPWRQP